ncbi:MAG: regulatory iron-sulfur-containing complex subunit RicT [Chloroflexota bacterium]|nr:regulatory iron-sulfur-containing complex subunit RicT [Chloroflexota bacterium]MDE2921103.1 regulatory iron-sulfur-containing complex subunit RicT [Chloroflexota bacterium]
MVAADAPARTARPIGVRFRRAGRLYYFDPGDAELAVGDYAIVETPRGLTAARVVMPATEVNLDDLRGELKPIVRRATDDDLVSMTNYRKEEVEAERAFAKAIMTSRLPMQAVKAEYTFDGATLTLHFSSRDARLELGDLVAEMAARFRTRVELRQVGPRERAAMRTGMGRCGRELCCATFLSELDTVSMRMAKDQNLPLNPDKISGACGRLLCCLQYEHAGYVEDKLAAEQAQGGGGCATSGACDSCGVHELKDVLGQAVAPGHEPEPKPEASEPEPERAEPRRTGSQRTARGRKARGEASESGEAGSGQEAKPASPRSRRRARRRRRGRMRQRPQAN